MNSHNLACISDPSSFIEIKTSSGAEPERCKKTSRRESCIYRVIRSHPVGSTHIMRVHNDEVLTIIFRHCRQTAIEETKSLDRGLEGESSHEFFLK